MNALRYIWLTMRHKWFVWVAGRRLGVPLVQLIVHDWTKFFLAGAYGGYFFGDRDQEAADRFMIAWLYHQNHEPHHWEYWVPRSHHAKTGQSASDGPMEMPERYVREMAADWLAANKTYTGQWPNSLEDWWWYQQNRNSIVLHPQSAAALDNIFKELFAEGGIK